MPPRTSWEEKGREGRGGEGRGGEGEVLRGGEGRGGGGVKVQYSGGISEHLPPQGGGVPVCILLQLLTVC